MVAGVKHQRAEYTADRLGEAAGRILRRRRRIGKAAAPGGSPPQRMRGEAMDDEDGYEADIVMKTITSNPL